MQRSSIIMFWHNAYLNLFKYLTYHYLWLYVWALIRTFNWFLIFVQFNPYHYLIYLFNIFAYFQFNWCEIVLYKELILRTFIIYILKLIMNTTKRRQAFYSSLSRSEAREFQYALVDQD